MRRVSKPAVLPVFPLTGSLLLPGNYLPLNIFEPRYRNLVRDVMEEGRLIGMIQPRTPMRDNLGPVRGNPAPELYRVGCAGKIDRCEPQPDGRYLIVLRGVWRFRVGDELATLNGYRRVRPEYGEFDQDENPGANGDGLDAERLVGAVQRFAERHRLEFDLDLLRSLPAVTLINALAAALPFPPGEQQALLEAPTVGDRERLLRDLMGMGLAPPSADDVQQPSTVH